MMDKQSTGSEQITKLRLFEVIDEDAEIRKIPFYNRRAFRYLAMACIALAATAIGAIFYNNHPKPVKDKERILKSDAPSATSKAALTSADTAHASLSEVDSSKLQSASPKQD